jgi:hypothetical protein
MAKMIGTNGTAQIQPVTVNNAILFLQRSGKKILELAYDIQIGERGGYVAADLTLLSENITSAGISGYAYQQTPFSILWAFLTDGSLVAMTYLREEAVVAWKNMSIGGNGAVVSLSTITGTGQDELWAVVERTINGSTVRYVEMLESVFTDDDDTFQSNNGVNAFHVDSGLTYNGAATTEINGLAHLEGETVKVVGDGGLQADRTVSDGKITISSASVVHVGLSYTATMQPMRPGSPLKDGSSQGRFTKIADIIIRVNNSLHFKVGRDSSNLDMVYDREYIPTIGSVPALFTGDVRGWYEGEWTRESRPLIIQDKPLPFTVVGLVYEVEFV